MAAIGHPDETVAAWCGVDVAVVRELQAGESVSSELETVVRAVYEQVATIPGRCPDTQRRARQGGWVTDLAWDDIDTDTGSQGIRPTPRADFAEATAGLLAGWKAAGLSVTDVARLLRLPEAEVAELYDTVPASTALGDSSEPAQQTPPAAMWVHVPVGIVTVVGVVVSVQPQVHPGGGPPFRMLVATAAGYRISSPVPGALTDRGDASELPGKRVQFTADVRRSISDQSMGFAKRPRMAWIVTRPVDVVRAG